MAKIVSTVKKQYLQELAQKQVRLEILETLKEESKTWLSNYEEGFDKVVIPNVTFRENDYFLKL